MANWFYDVLPAELQRRVYAHVLGQRLGGRPALLWLYQYEYRPDRSRATKLAIQLKRLAGLLGVPWAADGEPGGPLDGGVAWHDGQAAVEQRWRERHQR